MNRNHRSTLGAFTLIELIVIVGIIALLALVLIPGVVNARHKAERIHCISRLKQIGLSFRLWSGDNSGVYPMARSTNQQGTLEMADEVWRTFQVLSNELSTPFILACPSDSRDPAADFPSLANSNISYFISLDADEAMPELLLAGDRHLSVGRRASNRILTLQTNDAATWAHITHQGQGNVAFADGSVQQLSANSLHRTVSKALQIHWRERTNATLRLAMPE
jgi:prepilin-type processing-associated H-X9-DG protein